LDWRAVPDSTIRCGPRPAKSEEKGQMEERRARDFMFWRKGDKSPHRGFRKKHRTPKKKGAGYPKRVALRRSGKLGCELTGRGVRAGVANGCWQGNDGLK